MTLRRDQINRHRERARDERAELDAVLDAGHHVGTLSTVADGRPWVVPMLYGRAGDRILMHGSVGAGALRYVATGAPAALCVMHVDGWVYAHTLFDSSANYRSAVVHGELRALSGDEAAEALTQISECLTPGRSAEVPFHTKKQLAATTALAMDIVEGQWTVKIRDAGPGEPEPGEATPGCGPGSCRSSAATGTPARRTTCRPTRRSRRRCSRSCATGRHLLGCDPADQGGRALGHGLRQPRVAAEQPGPPGRPGAERGQREAGQPGLGQPGRGGLVVQRPAKTRATCSPASMPSARAAGMCSRQAATKRSCRAR